jgi:hypothetical protein
MQRSRLALVVPALLVLALSACTPPAPGGEFQPTGGPAIADESATPDVESSQAAEEYAPPPEWTNDELVGACKVEGDLAATGRSWEDYSSDASFAQTSSSWTVTFPALAGGDALTCEVSGTPADPTVVLS